jgi:uncharacterized protein YndB with AHSA1/START domain
MIRALIRFAVFVLVVGAIVLVGSILFLAPDYTVTTNVLIRVPPARVWEDVGDLAKWPSWVRGQERFDVVKGAGQEVGSVARVRVEAGFRSIDFDVHIVEALPGFRLRYRIVGGPQDGVTSEILLQTAEDGRATRVRWTESHTPPGLWGHLLAAALKPAVTTQHEESLNQLKFGIERAM